MPGKRKETMDIREMLRRIRQGQSNRAIAKDMSVDRKTAARYRDWAEEQSLLAGLNVTDELLETVRTDDVELLKLGLKWVRFKLFGNAE